VDKFGGGESKNAMSRRAGTIGSAVWRSAGTTDERIDGTVLLTFRWNEGVLGVLVWCSCSCPVAAGSLWLRGLAEEEK